MVQINGQLLRQKREAKNWSIDELARRSKIDRQTIHRIENGKGGKRTKVIRSLADALKVEIDELTSVGVVVDQTERLDELTSTSQLNLRVSDRSRNAILLAASQYGVSSAQIVEIAPYLFCWAAEQSLKRRREQVDSTEKAVAALEKCQPTHLHAAAFTNARSYEPLEEEKKSIEACDLFGKLVTEVPEDYDEAAENPFAKFLGELIADNVQQHATFSGWHPDESPEFTVCKDRASVFLGGDELAIELVLDGSVPLHKLPKELREKSKAEERAKWVHQENDARFPKSGLSNMSIVLDL
jgi:transcriptional regulator with XRE-family HTH domain